MPPCSPRQSSPPAARHTAKPCTVGALSNPLDGQLVPTAGKWTTLPDWKARRQELVKELREKVFRWFPREQVPFKSRVGPDKTAGWAERYADCKEVFFDTETSVPIRARLFKPRKL